VPTIRPFADPDEVAVIALWQRADVTRPWNDPRKDVARKRRVQRELFLVAVENDVIVGTVMAGYDGHRGWVNYLAVEPSERRRGIGRALMAAAEAGVRALGCPKLAVQVRADNPEALAFYERLGFARDAVVSMGKRLEQDD
jgi:ribosomal protein S18 acetylase RimI-like enzyme